MTLSQIEKAAWRYLTSRGLDEKRRIIRGVFHSEGKADLRILARNLTKLRKSKVRAYDLFRLGWINDYKKSRRGCRTCPGRLLAGSFRQDRWLSK